MTYTKDLDAAPMLLLSDVTTAATSPSGATVQFTVNAIDITGMTIIGVPCDPPSRSLFPEGETTVTCTATGSNGQTTTGSFRVTVTPFPVVNQAPVLQLPPPITVNATSARGRTVSYAVTATDDSGAAPSTVCTPPSGSRFPVGVTTVTCTATDAEQLSATGSFAVTVVDPLEPVCGALQYARGITEKNRLVAILNTAADGLQQAGRSSDATTIRNLVKKVKSSAYATIRPALRRTVVATVDRVSARACCRLPAPQA
jgi:hypothetical protein